MKIKRIYEHATTDDGYRLLVDRIWPRGVSKANAAIDEWNKIIAPSTELRKWFDHQPERFEMFKAQYKNELKAQTPELIRIKEIAAHQELTLLYGAKDERINHAVVLKEVLDTL